MKYAFDKKNRFLRNVLADSYQTEKQITSELEIFVLSAFLKFSLTQEHKYKVVIAPHSLGSIKDKNI